MSLLNKNNSSKPKYYWQEIKGNIERILNDGRNGKPWQALAISEGGVSAYLSSAVPISIQPGDEFVAVGQLEKYQGREQLQMLHLDLTPDTQKKERFRQIFKQGFTIKRFGQHQKRRLWLTSPKQFNAEQVIANGNTASNPMLHITKAAARHFDDTPEAITWMEQLAQNVVDYPIYIAVPEQSGYQFGLIKETKVDPDAIAPLQEQQKKSRIQEQQKKFRDLLPYMPQSIQYNAHNISAHESIYHFASLHKACVYSYASDPAFINLENGLQHHLVSPYDLSRAAGNTLQTKSMFNGAFLQHQPPSIKAERLFTVAHELGHALFFSLNHKPHFEEVAKLSMQEAFADSFAILAMSRDYPAEAKSYLPQLAHARRASRLFGAVSHTTGACCFATLEALKDLPDLKDFSTQDMLEKAFDLAHKYGDTPQHIKAYKFSYQKLWTDLDFKSRDDERYLTSTDQLTLLDHIRAQSDLKALEAIYAFPKDFISQALESFDQLGFVAEQDNADHQKRFQQQQTDALMNAWTYAGKTLLAAKRLIIKTQAQRASYQAYQNTPMGLALTQALVDFAQQTGLTQLQNLNMCIPLTADERPDLGMIPVRVTQTRSSPDSLQIYTQLAQKTPADRVAFFAQMLDAEQAALKANTQQTSPETQATLLCRIRQRLQAATFLMAHAETRRLAESNLTPLENTILIRSSQLTTIDASAIGRFSSKNKQSQKADHDQIDNLLRMRPNSAKAHKCS